MLRLALPAAMLVASTALAADMLPTPYTAAQIREACGDGRVFTFQLTDAEGHVVYQAIRFEHGTGKAVDVTSWSFDASGAPLEAPSTHKAKWTELRDHASFTTAEATRTRAMARTELGTFEVWQYDITSTTQDGKTQVDHMSFADTLAGPPLRWTTEVGGAVVMTWEHVGRGAPYVVPTAAPADVSAPPPAPEAPPAP